MTTDELVEKYIDQGMPVIWACINMRDPIVYRSGNSRYRRDVYVDLQRTLYVACRL